MVKHSRDLQRVGKFDTKTSSWARTPPEIRRLGGALYCDHRYDTVSGFFSAVDDIHTILIAENL